MTLPASFKAAGFTDPETARREGRKFKRLMLGLDGPADSGKTEFVLSAPGPGLVLCLDRGFDGLFDNPNPPAARRDDFAFHIIKAPLAGMVTKEDYMAHWKDFYEVYKKALTTVECRTFCLDGDSDSWELQRLAGLGRLTKIPPIQYTEVNAARRAMYARAFDSGKIIIGTNKVKRLYENILNADGTPKISEGGNEIREWTGKFERQGFSDQDYLWNIQLSMAHDETTNTYTATIKKCKAQPLLVGTILTNEECNFPTLVQVVYPDVPLSEWGY